MANPQSYDLQKSAQRIGDYHYLVVPLGDATLAAQDYLGNTAGDEGVPAPNARLQEAHITLTAADDGNTTVQIDNETQNTNHSFSLDADTFTQETGIDLYFSEGDEVSVQVNSVTTPGDGLSAVLVFEVEHAPMN